MSPVELIYAIGWLVCVVVGGVIGFFSYIPPDTEGKVLLRAQCIITGMGIGFLGGFMWPGLLPVGFILFTVLRAWK